MDTEVDMSRWMVAAGGAGEVSVPRNERGSTTYRFDEPGTVELACHLPGHYEYGMCGEIVVVPSESS